MYGLSLNRLSVACTLVMAASTQAATYSVSNQASCEAVPGAAWTPASICELGSNLALAGGDTLTIASPAVLRIPAGVALANNGGVVRVQLGGRFDNHGTLTQSTSVAYLDVAAGATLRNFGHLANGTGADVFSRGRIENAGSIANSGTFENHCGAFVNTGTFTGASRIDPHCWTGGAAGLWSAASNWSHGVVPPYSAYAVIGSGTATLDLNVNFLGMLLLESGHLVVAPSVTFTNYGTVVLDGAHPGTTTLRNQGVFLNLAIVENSNRFINEGTFSNFSTVRAGSAVGTLVNSGTWGNHPGATIASQGIDNTATGIMANYATMQLTLGESFNAGKVENYRGGTLTLDSKLRNRAGGTVANHGTLYVMHRLTLPGGIDNEAGARVQNEAGGIISITAAGAYINNAGLVRNDGGVVNRGVINNTGAVCGAGWISGNAVVGNAPAPACRAVANAGADRSVGEGTQVTLDGSGSSTPNGTPLAYAWTQTAGPAVPLDSTDPARPTFMSPYVAATTVLSFRLVVNDGFDASLADFVDVVVSSTNSAPVADAGDDRTAKAGSVVTLDASRSYDGEGNAIAFEWTQVAGPAVALVPWPDAPNPSFTAPSAAGVTLVFKLRASDGMESSVPSAGADPAQADTVAIAIVENSRPVAVAGPDRTVAENSLVLLDGGASRDDDSGDVLSYAWRQVAGPAVPLSNATSATASFTAPAVEAGSEVTLAFELVVRDNDAVNPLSSAPARVQVGVYNLNDPPRCDLAAPSVGSLWPPDFKMSTVGITGVLDDAASEMPLTVRITAVRQDEPPSGLTPADPAPDAVIVSGGAGHDSVQLRRQRSPHGNGRVYTIAFTAHDGLASCSGFVSVEVPHSRNGTAAADDGPVYDSTGG
jgi:hypothetical protein